MTTGPAREFVESRLRLAQEEFLPASRMLLEYDSHKSAVDGAYYSSHYCAVALLCHYVVRPSKSHAGLVGLFGSGAINWGLMQPEFERILGRALRARTSNTYSPDVEISQESAASSVENAERFLTAIRESLNQQQE